MAMQADFIQWRPAAIGAAFGRASILSATICIGSTFILTGALVGRSIVYRSREPAWLVGASLRDRAVGCAEAPLRRSSPFGFHAWRKDCRTDANPFLKEHAASPWLRVRVRAGTAVTG
jgi:hypothetical protein